MNELIKNLGVIVLIIGAAVLAVPFFTGGMTNSILLTGLGLVLLGYFGPVSYTHLPSASSVQSAVKPLLKNDLITQEDGFYRVYDYFFADWMARI